MDSPLVTFLAGALAGSALTLAALEVETLVKRRLFARRVKTMVRAVDAERGAFERNLTEDLAAHPELFAGAPGRDKRAGKKEGN